MSHTCSTLIVHCMDFRFQSAIRDWMTGRGLKDNYDVVSVAGSSKGLAQGDEAVSKLLLDHVELSQRLHGITQLILLHHMDCGAYGGHKAFADKDEEKEKHVIDLHASAEAIKKLDLGLRIECALAHITEEETTREINFETL